MPTILFLAADPSNRPALALDEETRAVRIALKSTGFRVAWVLAVRKNEILEAVDEHRPDIVHFSGHGDRAGHIFVEDDAGQSAPVDGASLASLLGMFAATVRVVVLNACYSAALGDAIVKRIDRVVGMSAAIGDSSAIQWSGQFYAALGRGDAVDDAFAYACTQIGFMDLSGENVPVLLRREGAPAPAPFVEKPPPVEMGDVAETPDDPPQVAPPAGENRVCTALLVDFGANAALLRKLAPEETKTRLDAAAAVVRAQVEAMGGAFLGMEGQRAWALFGAVRATDADAERAVRAALAIRAAVARKPARLPARIGIGTGRSFVEQDARGVRAVGEPAVEAERLAPAAAPGTVICEVDTYRQIVGLFDVTPIDAIGAGADRLPAYRIDKPAALRTRLSPPDFHGIATALMGRAGPRLALAEALDTVLAESRPRVVTLVGPAGIGRSRLAEDLFATLAQRPEPFVVLTAPCSRLGESTYGLLGALIRRRFAIQEGEPPDRVRRKLRRGVRWLRARVKRAAGGADLEGVDLDDALDQVASVLGVDSAGDKGDEAAKAVGARIAEAVTRLLRLVAARVPVVVIAEDIHWADAASLDLIDEITARGDDLRVCVVCTARPELFDGRPHWGEGRAEHQRLTLGPLERRFVEAMIRDRLRPAGEIPDALVRAVADLAEGSPFIAVETLHLLVDAGVVEIPAEGAWTVHADRLGALTLPATVQGLVAARLDQLDADARDTVARASVVGREFWEGAVDSLRRDVGKRSGATADMIARLRDRQIVRARETSTIAAEREYVFAEAATCDVAHDTLSHALARGLHAAVAAWLLSHAPEDKNAAMLARHYELAEDRERAAQQYARAAAYAASLGDNGAALDLLARVQRIQLGEPEDGVMPSDAQHGDAPVEQRVSAWRDRVRVCLDRADVLRRLGRFDASASACEEARAAVLRAERRAGQTLDPAEVARWDARIDFRAGKAASLSGSLADALVLIERSIAGAPAEELPPAIAERVFLLRRLKGADEAFRAAREGVRACRAARKGAKLPPEDFAVLLFSLATASFARGRFTATKRCYRWAERVLDETKSPVLWARAVNGVGAALNAAGAVAQARDEFRRAQKARERIGDQHQIAAGDSNLAEVELALGNVAAALDLARRAVSLGERIHAGYDLADMYKNLAAAEAAAGDLGAALAAGEKAVAGADAGSRIYLGDAAATLADACAKAAASPDEALRARAAATAAALRATVDRSFTTGKLAARADAVRAVLAAIPPP